MKCPSEFHRKNGHPQNSQAPLKSKQGSFQWEEQSNLKIKNISSPIQESQIQSDKYMLFLQALLNSFVVDYFIRQKINAHVNSRFLLPLKVPRFTEKKPCFQKLVEKSAFLTCIGKEFNELADEIDIPRGGIKDEKKRWETQGEIDAMVAHIYGLTLEEFKYILSTFTTGNNQERLEALKKYALSAFEKISKENVLDEVS